MKYCLRKKHLPRQIQENSFTLIELLVVMFVIAVLTLLFVPVYNGIRASAIETRCKSNLKEIGVAMNQYFTDHNGCFPGGAGLEVFAARYGQGDNIELSIGNRSLEQMKMTQTWYKYQPTGGEIISLFENYVRGTNDVRFCPTADLEIFDEESPKFKGKFWNETVGDWVKDRDVITWNHSVSYMMNDRLSGNYKGDFDGDTIAFIERNILHHWGDAYGAVIRNPGVRGTWAMERDTIGNRSPLLDIIPPVDRDVQKPAIACKYDVGFNHNNGANYLAVDGRVSWISSNDISAANF